MLPIPIPVDTATAILKEAVDIEEAFVKAALPQNLVGLGHQDMIEYVRYCADPFTRYAKHRRPCYLECAPTVCFYGNDFDRFENKFF